MPFTEAQLEHTCAELLAQEGLGFVNAPATRQASYLCNGSIDLS
jgi:hypothetical protein